tara:strand:+ start:265 stop:471 length:207 start_codon:yes stop_codon:yes gene_type:complete
VRAGYMDVATLSTLSGECVCDEREESRLSCGDAGALIIKKLNRGRHFNCADDKDKRTGGVKPLCRMAL